MKVQKDFSENFCFWWCAGQKTPKFAYMFEKVGFTAIINYFDLDITPYVLFSVDNYKIKTLQASNFHILSLFGQKMPLIAQNKQFFHQSFPK